VTGRRLTRKRPKARSHESRSTAPQETAVHGPPLRSRGPFRHGVHDPHTHGSSRSVLGSHPLGVVLPRNIHSGDLSSRAAAESQIDSPAQSYFRLRLAATMRCLLWVELLPWPCARNRTRAGTICLIRTTSNRHGANRPQGYYLSAGYCLPQTTRRMDSLNVPGPGYCQVVGPVRDDEASPSKLLPMYVCS